MTFRIMFAAAVTLCLLAAGSFARAEETKTVKPYCPDAEVLSEKLINKVPWNTLFPIRVAGASMGGNPDSVPENAAPGQSLCLCEDNNQVPFFGTQISLWEPARIIEVVRVAGCTPTLGGAMLDSNPLLIGGPTSKEHDTSDKIFYNVNYYAFPLLVMLDLLDIVSCKADGYMDLDLINVSAIDPTWEDDELAFVYTPEVVITMLPPAQALCPVDAIASTVGRPIDKLSWCAGTWGSLYPFTGNDITNASPPRDSSLVGTRMLAKMHRMGLAHRTMGKDVMCKSKIFVTVPKSQYRMSMFFPMAEVEGVKDMGDTTSRSLKGSHVIGESTYRWGEWRNIPGTGEDFVYLLWRWMDCCAVKAPTT